MRVALVGNGFNGGGHRAAYRTLKAEGEDITLAAICDIRPEKLEDNDGANVYTDIDEMLATEKDLDYIDLSVPTHLHAELAIKCMKAGYHVLCEKPMAINVEEAQKMIDCSKETGKKLMIAHCARFSGLSRTIRNFVMEGKFGKPQSAFFTAGNANPDWGWNDWFKKKECSGGAMLDLQAHTLDLIYLLFGMPKAVSSVAVERNDYTGYTSSSGNFIYDDGLFVHSWCDWWILTNKHQNRVIRINFEHGYLFVNKAEGVELVAVDECGNETLLEDISGNNPNHTNITVEIKYFITCLKNNQPFRMCTLEESLKVIEIFKAQEKSSDNNGMPVYLE